MTYTATTPLPPPPTAPAAPSTLPAPASIPVVAGGAQPKRASKAKKTALDLRATLWPQVTDSMLWIRDDKSRKGFTTIPRLMPLFMEVIAAASKHVTGNKAVPAGKSYLVLWCRVFDEGLVKIDNDATAAFEAGYVGERNVSTWREHLRVLKELEFIDVRPGPAGSFQYVLLFNPYHATKRLRQKGWVQELTYTTLIQRAGEIGATDLKDLDVQA